MAVTGVRLREACPDSPVWQELVCARSCRHCDKNGAGRPRCAPPRSALTPNYGAALEVPLSLVLAMSLAFIAVSICATVELWLSPGSVSTLIA